MMISHAADDAQGPILEMIRSLLTKQSGQFLAISRSDLIPWTILLRSDYDPSVHYVDRY